MLPYIAYMDIHGSYGQVAGPAICGHWLIGTWWFTTMGLRVLYHIFLQTHILWILYNYIPLDTMYLTTCIFTFWIILVNRTNRWQPDALSTIPHIFSRHLALMIPAVSFSFLYLLPTDACTSGEHTKVWGKQHVYINSWRMAVSGNRNFDQPP